MSQTETEQKDVIRERNTIKEARAVLRISHASFYERVKAGHIKTIKDGGRRFVTRAELERYLSAGDVAPL